MTSSRLAIGIGNLDRGDDAAGVLVVRQLKRTPTMERTDCSDLMDLWDDHDDVVVIDAMLSGSPPGTVKRIDAGLDRLPARCFASTHSFGLSESVELARTLGRLPGRLTIYGIEGADFALGSAVSSEVARAVANVVDELESNA